MYSSRHAATTCPRGVAGNGATAKREAVARERLLFSSRGIDRSAIIPDRVPDIATVYLPNVIDRFRDRWVNNGKVDAVN